jgi:hypothetical protein
MTNAIDPSINPDQRPDPDPVPDLGLGHPDAQQLSPRHHTM